jgi:hypothetical protein
MKVCFLVLEPHFGCQIGLCKVPINFGFSIEFWIPTESALKSKNHLAMCRLFRSSSSPQNSDCQLRLLPTIVRLALTTHPGERSLSIGDELAEKSASFEKPHNPNSPGRSQYLALVRPHELEPTLDTCLHGRPGHRNYADMSARRRNIGIKFSAAHLIDVDPSRVPIVF